MIQKIKYFIILGRFKSPTGALLLAWPCLWGINMAQPDLSLFLNIQFFFFLGHLF